MKRTIHIMSDGTGADTVVVDSDGNELPNIYGMTIQLEAREVNKAAITVLGAKVDTHAEVEHVTFVCPLCSEAKEHTCGGEAYQEEDLDALMVRKEWDGSIILTASMRGKTYRHDFTREEAKDLLRKVVSKANSLGLSE